MTHDAKTHDTMTHDAKDYDSKLLVTKTRDSKLLVTRTLRTRHPGNAVTLGYTTAYNKRTQPYGNGVA